MSVSEAADKIAEITAASNVRQAYYDGQQDGALSILAPALGVDPGTGTTTHQLMGRRFKVSIEWLDPIDDRHLDVARAMAKRAQDRAAARMASVPAPL